MTQVELTVADAVAVITITPPELFMDRFTVDELAAVIEQVDGDQAVRAVVLTGGNKDYFIRHYDVRELGKIAELLATKQSFDPAKDTVPERDIDIMFNVMAASVKPFIAAINGNAMGGGFETALACDFRVAQAGDYSLGQPEINIGILPGAGGTQRLARLIGIGAAMDLCLTGRTVSPEEALALGMVHRVADDALAEALSLARTLAAKPPRAMAYIKRLLQQSVSKPLPEALLDERTLFRDLMTSADAIRLMKEMNEGGKDIRDMSPGGG